jgi:hypothetical protein
LNGGDHNGTLLLPSHLEEVLSHLRTAAAVSDDSDGIHSVSREEERMNHRRFSKCSLLVVGDRTRKYDYIGECESWCKVLLQTQRTVDQILS